MVPPVRLLPFILYPHSRSPFHPFFRFPFLPLSSCQRSSPLPPENVTAAITSYTVGKVTLPWADFRFHIFSNYLQKFEKIKITVRKSGNLTMYGIFCLDLY